MKTFTHLFSILFISVLIVPAYAQWGLNGNSITNTNYLGTTGGETDPLNIRTNGINRITITSAGNVGIGTSSPTYKLHIIGTINLGGYTTIASGQQIQSGVNYGAKISGSVGNTAASPAYGFLGENGIGIYRPTTASLSFSTSSVERMRINSSGNIGIGTSTPSAKLHIAGTTLLGGYTTIASGQQIQSGVNYGAKISGSVGNTAASPAYGFLGENGIGLYRPATHTLSFSTSNFERMRISSSGSVGIGNASPVAKLDVLGGASIAGTELSSGIFPEAVSVLHLYQPGMTSLGTKNQLLIGSANVNGSYSQIGFGWTNHVGVKYAAGVVGFITTNHQDFHMGDLIFATRNTNTDVAPAERMRITSAGNVGIGTNNPEIKLDVRGGASIAGTEPSFNPFPAAVSVLHLYQPGINTLGTKNQLLIGSANNIGNLSQIGFGWTNGNINYAPAVIGFVATNAQTHVYGDLLFATRNTINDVAPTERMRITSNGNVGIGTANTGSFKLAVEGKIGSREVVVTQNAWADFVFDEQYKLKPLYEVEKFIKRNKHLPNVPSEKIVQKEGLNLGKMDAVLLQKIEELTLYVIELQKQVDELKKYKENVENK